MFPRLPLSDGGLSATVTAGMAAGVGAAVALAGRGASSAVGAARVTRSAVALAVAGRGARGRVGHAPLTPSHSATTSATTPDQAASATPGGGSPIPPFHLAIPVADIDAARDFYGSKLGCPEGRSAATWVDFNLAGHQLVCHEVPGYDARSTASAVDGDPVPVPHFGLALPLADFQALAARVAGAGIVCELGPRLRFRGAPGEQWTMFFRDPSGNALEFKAMSKPENLFARYKV